jgi:hypothetical protein
MAPSVAAIKSPPGSIDNEVNVAQMTGRPPNGLIVIFMESTTDRGDS